MKNTFVRMKFLMLSLLMVLGISAVHADELFFPIANSTAGNYFKSYTVDGVTVTVSSPGSISSSSGDYFVQLGSTPSNANANYIEISVASGTLGSVSFAFTGNGADKTCQPAVLGWKTAVAANDADFVADGISTLISAKGNANAQWFTYDLSGEDLTIVRVYRAVKSISVAGAAAAQYGGGQTLQFYGVRVELDGAVGTSPNITVASTPAGDFYQNLYTGSPSEPQTASISATNLTGNVTVTAPADYEVSKNGTTWSSSLTYTPTAGTVSESTFYVRLNASSNGTKSGNITISSDGATTRTIAVSGVVVNLTPLATPSNIEVSDASSSGFTVNWTGVPNNNGYEIHIYNALTNAEVSVTDVAQNATSQIIGGLNPLTSYYVKLVTKGNGSTSGNSALSAASNTITTTKASNAMTTCMSEDFSSIEEATSSGNCPTSAGAPGVMVRAATSVCDDAYLTLAGGTWHGQNVGYTASGYDGKSLYFKYTNSKEGYIELPATEMAKKITFYVKLNGTPSNSTEYTRGIVVKQGNTPITEGILVDDAELPYVASGKLSTYTLRDNGVIQVSTSWAKVEVPLDPNNTGAITITSSGANSAANFYLDNVTVSCDPQELTISPDLSGLNYVEDLGPSQEATITLTGSGLPTENGTAMLTGVSNFEISFDGGTTWVQGDQSFPYTGDSFTKSVKVRLPAGLTAGGSGATTFTDNFRLSASGYGKTSPSISVTGKVTLFPTVLNCGETVSILNLKGTESTKNLVDAVTGDSWSESGTISTVQNLVNANVLKLAINSSLNSPAIGTSEYDLTTLSFDMQPLSGSSDNTLTVQLYDAEGNYLINTTDVYPNKAIYNFSRDISSLAATGNYTLRISTGGKKEINIWNIKLEGVAKRKMTFTPGAIDDLQSYPDCPSEVRELKIIGTCLDDDSNLKLASASANYEFSENGTSGWTNNPVFSYTGEFPLTGKTIYVRQKQALTPGNVQETVTFTNNGKGTAQITFGGNASNYAGWTPADGETFDFSSVQGQSKVVSIPIVADKFCAPITVSTSCPGLQVSNCIDDGYATNTSFSADVTDRTLFLKYTPGTLTNCNVAINAGGATHNIKINWGNAPAVASGVQPSSSAVDVPVASYGTVQLSNVGSLPATSVVTVTSDKFEFSMGSPDYGDFTPATEFKLSDMQGTLYIKPESGTTAGQSESVTIATAGGSTATITVTAK